MNSNRTKLSMQEILALIPSDLYQGISGDEEDIIIARKDRERDLMTQLRWKAFAAEDRGDIETANLLFDQAIALGGYFSGWLIDKNNQN